MKETSSTSRSHERWAHFRFSVIGPLLAAPASRGELQGQLQELAAKKWRHPISGERVLFGLSTIERWYYKALRSKAGPVEALKRKIRSDHAAGRFTVRALKRLSIAMKPGKSAATRAHTLTDFGIWIFITAPCACC